MFPPLLFTFTVLRSWGEGNKIKTFWIKHYYFCYTMGTVSQHGKGFAGSSWKERKLCFCCLWISWQLSLRKLMGFQDITWPGLKSQIIFPGVAQHGKKHRKFSDWWGAKFLGVCMWYKFWAIAYCENKTKPRKKKSFQIKIF